jgi:hypothetical protein
METGVVRKLISLGAVAACCGSAQGATYDCEAADKLSKIGVSSSSSVSITADSRKRECRFSINGVAAGSPPQDQIDRAITIQRSGAFASSSIGREESRAIATLLVTAAAETSVPESLVGFIEQNQGPLRNCFAKAGSREKLGAPGNFSGECGGTAEPTTVALPRIRASLSAGVNWLYVTDGSVTHAFFFARQSAR